MLLKNNFKRIGQRSVVGLEMKSSEIEGFLGDSSSKSIRPSQINQFLRMLAGSVEQKINFGEPRQATHLFSQLMRCSNR